MRQDFEAHFCALSLHRVLFVEFLVAQTFYKSVKSLAMQEPEPGTFRMPKGRLNRLSIPAPGDINAHKFLANILKLDIDS